MKNRGLAILFGLVPGAGHMYLGKMRRGMTLMLMFAGDIALAVLLNMGVLCLALPIIWFFSFFDNLNLSALSNDRLELAPDPFLFGLLDNTKVKDIRIFQKKNALLGWGFIILGIVMLYNTFASTLLRFLEDTLGYSDEIQWLWSLYYKFPQLIIAVVIIVLGVHFMKGGKKQAQLPDDITPYHGS